MKTISLGTGVRLCIATFLLLTISFANAADFHWKSPVNGNFATPGNWDPAGPPTTSDSVIFDLGSAGYTVSNTFNTVDTVKLGNDTLEISGAFLHASNPSLPSVALGINAGDVANRSVSSFGIGGVNDAIGYAAQSQGSATLTEFSTWGSVNLYVGYAGIGSLALQSRSSAVATETVRIGALAGSQGTMTLDDGSSLTVTPPQDNSNALVVGVAGSGTLTVNSGTITVTNQMVVAQGANSQGAVTLDGANSTLTTPSSGNLSMSGLTIGYGGDGTFAINNGAQATIAGPLMIGRNGGSTSSLSVAGDDSVLKPPGFGNATIDSVTVGASGDGTLAVSAGGTAILGGAVVLGQQLGSKGSVTIDGASSLVDSLNAGSSKIESVTVGDLGQAKVAVTAGGVAKLSGPIVLGKSASGNGTVSVDGADSKLISGSSKITGLTVGGSGVGSLSVTAGGLMDIGAAVQIGQGAGSNGKVTVDGGASSFKFDSITIGGGGTGNLSINHGATSTTTKSIMMARDNGSSGGVTVDGGGSEFSFNGATIGAAGSATFAVAHGAQALSNQMLTLGRDVGSSGGVTVDGGGSKLTFLGATIGGSGAGTFELTAGATAVFASAVTLGVDVGASGTMNIDGGGSAMTDVPNLSNSVTVGFSGQGQVTIGHAGVLKSTSGGMMIAANAGSTGSVSVDGAGSNPTLLGNVPGYSESIVIGQGGSGSLSVTGGATVTSGQIEVGRFDAGQGSLLLDGAGTSLTITGSPNHSSSVNGSVEITGGALWSSNRVTIGSAPTGESSVTVDGANSQWKASSNIVLGSSGLPTSLTISNGGAVSTPGLSAFLGSTINIDGGTLTTQTLSTTSELINNGQILGAVTVNGGVMSGAGSVSGRVTVNSGVISPGNSPGTMTVGGVVFTDATFNLEMNSASGVAGGPIGWDLIASTLGAGFNNHLTIAPHFVDSRECGGRRG